MTDVEFVIVPLFCNAPNLKRTLPLKFEISPILAQMTKVGGMRVGETRPLFELFHAGIRGWQSSNLATFHTINRC